jgi:hypothetical protein
VTGGYLEVARRMLREQREGGIPALELWPESLRELQRERADIMHFDGGLPLEEAEARATVDVWQAWTAWGAQT